MKTNTGWIKLYRSLWDQEQSADPAWVAVWMYLLTHAAHEETEVTFKGEKVKLKPGQLIVTIRSFTNAMPSLKRDRVHRLLCGMTEDRLIAKRSDRRFTFITVLEWDSYQCSFGQSSETEQEEKKKKTKRTGLVVDNPPSIEEVVDYIVDQELNVDSGRFLDYYTAAGWLIEANGKNTRPAKNWKLLARQWHDRNGSAKPAKDNGADRIDYGKVMKEVKRASR